MSKVSTTQTASNTTTLEDLRRYVSIQINDILTEVNGRLSFGQNIKTVIVTASFPAADTSVEVAHSLGLVPLGYIQIGSDQPVIIYDGGANTVSSVFLKASGATFPANARVMLF